MSERPPRRLEARPLPIGHPSTLRLSFVLWVIGGLMFVALAIPALADIVQVVNDAAYTIAVNLENGVLVGFAKVLYGRPRPPFPLVETTSYSFPPGQAVAGAAIAISLVLALLPAGPRRRNLEILAGAFALIMGLSRVYLRAHWLSDAVAGVALGAAVAIGAAGLIHVLEERVHQ